MLILLEVSKIQVSENKFPHFLLAAFKSRTKALHGQNLNLFQLNSK